MKRARSLGRVITATILLLGPGALSADWSRFRGPNGSGIAGEGTLPARFGPDTNVHWRTEVPFGRSSPVVAGERIFLTGIDGGKPVTLALDRSTGDIVWRREMERGHTAELHKDTDSTTPSPVTDGSNVYAFFHEVGLVSYDADGRERWRLPLGPFRNFYGIASSPVLAGRSLLMLCDQAEGSFLLAVDRETGEPLWRRERPARLESYVTPVLFPDEGEPRLVVVAGSRWIDAYDLSTGRPVWTLGGVGSAPVASPALAGDLLVVSGHDHAESGWPDFDTLTAAHDGDGDGRLTRTEVEGSWLNNHFGWLDADASGQISGDDWQRILDELVHDQWGVFGIRLAAGDAPPEKLWNYRQNVPYIPSPLIHHGVVYLVRDGVVTALDAATGERRKRGRIEGGSPKVYASPIAADGKLFIGTLDGRVVVFEAKADWETLAVNDLGAEIWATPAVAGGHLYVRTREALYDFALPTKIVPAVTVE